MSDDKPIRLSTERLRTLTPSALITRAINCLDRTRRECDQHGAWISYDDVGIRSVRGDQGQYTGPVCTDAGPNANYIALMSPPIGLMLSDMLLLMANQLHDYQTWDQIPREDGYLSLYAWSMVIINRFYDIMDVPESEAI
jgi:hypothetical protein